MDDNNIPSKQAISYCRHRLTIIVNQLGSCEKKATEHSSEMKREQQFAGDDVEQRMLENAERESASAARAYRHSARMVRKLLHIAEKLEKETKNEQRTEPTGNALSILTETI